MASTIEYKGYISTLEYSSEDKCFFGKLEMIDDLVTFEATTVKELESSFHKAVDEYLETCKQLNRKPEKVYKGVFNVRIDPMLHKTLYKNALKSGLSLNSYIQKALQREVSLSN